MVSFKFCREYTFVFSGMERASFNTMYLSFQRSVAGDLWDWIPFYNVREAVSFGDGLDFLVGAFVIGFYVF